MSSLIGRIGSEVIPAVVEIDALAACHQPLHVGAAGNSSFQNHADEAIHRFL